MLVDEGFLYGSLKSDDPKKYKATIQFILLELDSSNDSLSLIKFKKNG